MSTLDAPTRVSKRQELREDTVVTVYARAWSFFDRHRRLIYGVLAVLVALVIGAIAYSYYQQQQGEEAQQLLGGVVGSYESGNYRAALDGAEGAPGLLTIADEYGGTEAGNLARFYAADALYQLGEYDRALQYFESFNKEENYLGASAYAGEAAIYENQGNFQQAGAQYRRAALFYENELTSPQYLLFAGRAYEEAGAFEEAREAYQLIEERFSESDEAEQVSLYLARVDAKANAAS